MNCSSFFSKPGTKVFLTIPVSFVFLCLIVSAQTPPNKASAQPGSQRKVEQELVRVETGFFEAWKAKDQDYFRDHMNANAVFWGDSGTFSRGQVIEEQQASAKACMVNGYSLSDF